MSEKEKAEKLIKLFQKKYKMDDYIPSIFLIEEIFNESKGKKMVDFNDLEKKKASDFGLLRFLMDHFYKHFWENEAIKTLKEFIWVPLFERKSQKQIIFYEKNGKLIVNECSIIALYSHNQKQFKLIGFPDQFKERWERYNLNLSFYNASIINNVNVGEADQIANWVRFMIYIDKNIDKVKYTLKTTNLMKFTVTNNKSNYGDVSLYVIADFGIKDMPVKSFENIIYICSLISVKCQNI